MQDNFVEINPKSAADRGIRNGEFVWVKTPPMAAVPEFKGLRVAAVADPAASLRVVDFAQGLLGTHPQGS